MALKGKDASLLLHNSSLILALVTSSLSTQKAQVSAWMLVLSPVLLQLCQTLQSALL